MEAPLVERLQKAVAEIKDSSEGYWCAWLIPLLEESADEIERLEAEYGYWRFH